MTEWFAFQWHIAGHWFCSAATRQVLLVVVTTMSPEFWPDAA